MRLADPHLTVRSNSDFLDPVTCQAVFDSIGGPTFALGPLKGDLPLIRVESQNRARDRYLSPFDLVPILKPKGEKVE